VKMQFDVWYPVQNTGLQNTGLQNNGLQNNGLQNLQACIILKIS